MVKILNDMNDSPAGLSPHLGPLPPEATWASERRPDALGDALQELLRVATHVRPALAQRLGMTPTEVEVFEHLIAEPLGPAEVARRVHRTTAATSMAVDRLEAAGHVHREPHPNDGRRQMVVPTPTGMASVFSAIGPMVAALDAAGEQLSPRQREAVTAYLRDVTEALRHVIEGD